MSGVVSSRSRDVFAERLVAAFEKLESSVPAGDFGGFDVIGPSGYEILPILAGASGGDDWALDSVGFHCCRYSVGGRVGNDEHSDDSGVKICYSQPGIGHATAGIVLGYADCGHR
ncbi:hypothetical protein ElyMa_002942100 [Elysia marginata]|uniref:Uncharacterized protein n=1 Tax=Elysia marginata TaxID=1093978 RepID=A0AAV4I7W4_9GAST|nr:hypothetical protein ElyMa_002942100 [Elysia marginata]